MLLIRPGLEHVAGFEDALVKGWSPNHMRATSAIEELDRVRADAKAYVDGLEDRDAQGPPLILPDGTRIAGISRVRRWIWDGEFCGLIGLRWQKGTAALPPQILGHIGFAVVPWKQRRGYASQALADLLPLAREVGLSHVELTTDPDNIASQRVIEKNGGAFVERFVRDPSHGATTALRYRIVLGPVNTTST